MASVTLKNIRKIYAHSSDTKKNKTIASKEGIDPQITEQGVIAVQDFNLEISDKEFIVLVGPSGCGKSTTLRMIAGLETITDGELFIDDELVNDVPPKDRDIAMVFQNYALYPHMTVYENMAFALKLKKVSKEKIAETVNEAASILGITELLRRKPKALSGGQRQRVAIGRAIVRHPKVFLMDEPLSNLDAKLRNQMRAELIKLRQKVNTTFIYVTHDQTEAMTLGDRIVIMKDGTVQQIGTPHQVFNEPANLFVAGFIGAPQMNILPAQLVMDGGKYFIKIKETMIQLSDYQQKVLCDKKQPPADVILGVRPEHIKIELEAAPNLISAEVDISEMMGSEILLHVNASGHNVTIRISTTKLQESYAFEYGYKRRVWFTFPAETMHLFDLKTEQNLLINI